MDTRPQAMHRQAASWVGVVEAMLAFLLTLIACHPERSEGSAFPAAKSRSFALLRMTF